MKRKEKKRQEQIKLLLGEFEDFKLKMKLLISSLDGDLKNDK